jgi:hypothetical protein
MLSFLLKKNKFLNFLVSILISVTLKGLLSVFRNGFAPVKILCAIPHRLTASDSLEERVVMSKSSMVASTIPKNPIYHGKRDASNFLLDAGWGRLAIDSFYPSGEPISPHRLRCNPFAVAHYSFMDHCLASFYTRVGRRVSARE